MSKESHLIFLYMGGIISGIGIALAFLINSYFFLLFAAGFLPYIVLLEKFRAKKNPPC